MEYTAIYKSPVGELLLASDDIGLTGIWFDKDKFNASKDSAYEKKETPFISEAKRWLDVYFQGKEPDFTPTMHVTGTPFQEEVWEMLSRIPYGKTTTYGEIAGELARRRGIPKMSAQAVGSAVGRNKISIAIPCHRVIGADGSLTGYGGGLDKKTFFLKLEGVSL